MLVFDVRSDRVLLVLQELQHFPDRRVTFAPWHVRPTVPFSVLEMKARNPRVVFSDVSHCIEAARGEVANVQIDRSLQPVDATQA